MEAARGSTRLPTEEGTPQLVLRVGEHDREGRDGAGRAEADGIGAHGPADEVTGPTSAQHHSQGHVDQTHEDEEAEDDGHDEDGEAPQYGPAELRRDRSGEAEEADGAHPEDPVDEGDQGLGEGVGELHEAGSLVFRQGADGRPQQDGEHDQGEQRPAGSRLERIPGDQAQEEVHQSRELGRRLGLDHWNGDLGGERDGQGHGPHADEDGRDGRDPEEEDGEPTELPHLPRVTEACHPHEDDGHHQGDHHHLDCVDERSAQRSHAGGEVQQERDSGGRGDEAEGQSRDEAQGQGPVVDGSMCLGVRH